MKIEVAVDVSMLTAYALNMLRDQADPLEILLSANKREIFALARADIQSQGKDGAPAAVLQRYSPDQLTAAEAHVRSVFPEID